MIATKDEYKERSISAVIESNTFFAAKHCIEIFLAFSGNEKELEVDYVTLYDPFQRPKTFELGFCNKLLAKVGLKVSAAPASDRECTHMTLSRIKRKDNSGINESSRKRRRLIRIEDVM